MASMQRFRLLRDFGKPRVHQRATPAATPRCIVHNGETAMQDIKRGRRQAIRTIGAALAASALPMPFINVNAQERSFAGKTLRLLTWSDDTGAAALRNIAATFTAKTGAKVIADRADGTSGMVAKVKAAGDRPTYDVITLAGVGAAGIRGGGPPLKTGVPHHSTSRWVPQQNRPRHNSFCGLIVAWSREP